MKNNKKNSFLSSLCTYIPYFFLKSFDFHVDICTIKKNLTRSVYRIKIFNAHTFVLTSRA